jgi:hypothetical protein
MPNENNAELIECEFCNESLPSNDFSDLEFFNYENICRECKNDEFTYSSRCDLYVARDDWDDDRHADYPEDEDYRDDDDDERDEYVNNYSRRVDNSIRKMPYEKNLLKGFLSIGVELEVQIKSNSSMSRNDIAYNLQHEVFNDFVICKEDASIGYGFEIVSSPATFDYHKVAWEKFFISDEIKNLRSFKDQTTGLHIHINQSYVSKLAVGKILYFINSETNSKFLDSISGRKQTSYCYRDKNLKIKNVSNYRDRGAFNIYVDHSPTHEFRLFNGNIKKESFFRCLEFVVSLTNYAKNNCSLINPNYLDFIRYVSVNHFHYPYLTNWLIDKKYIKNLKHKTKFYEKKKVRKICA